MVEALHQFQRPSRHNQDSPPVVDATLESIVCLRDCFYLCHIKVLKVSVIHGSSSGLGIHMQVSMEVLIIEGGVSAQILSEPFSRYGKWVTHCWLRSV